MTHLNLYIPEQYIVLEKLHIENNKKYIIT